VFDETHFGGFVSNYLRGICFFDIHPPLGKLIIAASARLSGYDGMFNFSNVEGSYSSSFYVWLRFPPAVFSTFVSPLLAGSLMLGNVGLIPSVFAGILTSFEFTSIVQGRLILTDGILYFFVSLTIFATSLVEFRPTWPAFILQSFAAACALSVKFTGACVLAVVALSHFRMLFGTPRWFPRLCVRGVVVAAVCVVFSFILFWIHLSLMPIAGFGDQYMPPDFRRHAMPRRIVELVAAMYRYNRDLSFTHPYASKWYEWPFFIASPTVVHSGYHGELLCIFNNPVIALMSFVGFLAGFGSWNFQYSFGYFAAYAPFILVTRCMWTYHYEIALFFGVLALAQAIGRVSTLAQFIIGGTILAAALLAYWYWFAWIYAVPKPAAWHAARSLWQKIDYVVQTMEKQERQQKRSQSRREPLSSRRSERVAGTPYEQWIPSAEQGRAAPNR
jgi:dolichyl-phosphate-mannose--protein O-mannosyl transferase